jgi:hypothetical protein
MDLFKSCNWIRIGIRFPHMDPDQSAQMNKDPYESGFTALHFHQKNNVKFTRLLNFYNLHRVVFVEKYDKVLQPFAGASGSHVGNVLNT